MNDWPNAYLNWGDGVPATDPASPAPTAPVPKESPVVTAKKEQLQATALQKKAIYGSPEEQLRIAAAQLQGNNLAQSKDVQDLTQLSPEAFAQRYGAEAERDRVNYAEALLGLTNTKNRQRGSGQTVGDALIDAGIMAGNTLGGLGVLAANAIDATQGTTMSPVVSETLEGFNDWARSKQSQLAQDRRQIHDMEASLAAEDRESAYQERLAENADAETAWDRSVAPWLQKQGAAIADTVSNYADDPIMLGSLAVEGVGSMAPTTLGIRAAGRVGAMRTLASRGVTGEAAEEFLRTRAGRELIDTEAMAAAPVMMGVTETGAAIDQTQQDMLAIPEEELLKSPEYQALLSEGLSPRDARLQLARLAGTTAGIASAPGALLAGRIAAPFAANPLRNLPGRTATDGAANMVRETIEEGLQEANARIANNYGVQTQGIMRALDDGVAEAATQGAMGGALTAGTLQAPGMTVNTAREAGAALVNGGQAVANARADAVAARRDAASPVGTNARQKAAERMETVGSEVLAGLDAVIAEKTPEQVQPDTAEEPDVSSMTPASTESPASPVSPMPMEEARDVIARGLFLDDAEQAEAAQAFPGIGEMLATAPGRRVRRSQMVEEAGAVFSSRDAAPDLKTAMAVTMLQNLDDMRRLDSTGVNEVLGSVAEDHPIRKGYDALKTDLITHENSPVVAEAREFLGTLTSDQVREYIPVEALRDETVPAEQKTAIASVLATIAKVNPEAVSLEDYDLVLDQVGSGRGAEILKRSLETSKNILESFRQADEAKALILQRQEQENEARKASTGTANFTLHKTQDIVREEIHTGGNSSNRLPSLKEHFRRVTEAAEIGRVQDATNALVELRNFAQSQANKVEALNISLRSGQGRKAPVQYRAYGPHGFYETGKQQGVFVDPRYPRSIALAREVHVDAATAAHMVNTLADTYALPVEQITAPELDAAIRMPGLDITYGSPSATAANAATVGMVADTVDTPDTASDIDAAAIAAGITVDAGDIASDASVGTEPMQEASVPETVSDQDIQGEVAPAEPEATASPAVETENQQTQTQQQDGPQTRTKPQEETETADPEAEDVLGDDPVEEEAASVSWFDGLKSKLVTRTSDGFNVFLNAFRPAKRGSILTAHEYPTVWLVEQLDGMDELTSEQKEALRNTLDESFNYFHDMFDGLAQALIQKLEGSKWGVDGSLTFANALPLNFYSKDENGTYTMNPQVEAATFMALTEWMLSNVGPLRSLDDEEINKMFGRARGDLVTPEMREAARHGATLQSASETIANKIMTLLDVTPKDDVTIRQTQGLFRSLASSALEAVMDVQDKQGNVTEPRLISALTTPYLIPDPENDRLFLDRKLMTLRTRDGLLDDPDFAELAKLRDPFTRIFTKGRLKERHIGKPPTQVAQTQMGNRLARLSRMERQVVERLQNTPSYLNQPMVELVEALGSDGFNALLGFQALDANTKISPDHRKSIEGRNQTLQHDLEETLNYIAETRQVAGGTNPYDTPIYFEFEVSSVGRLQQKGRVTPQGSKTARELIAATNAELDLSNQEHRNALWLAVAQSIGTKVEKLSLEEAIADAQEKLTNPAKLEPALFMLQAHVRGEALDGKALKAALDKAGFAVSPKLLHALLTVARANEAEGTPEFTSFKTALALEADGKTDGPVNAMVHMGTNAFTAEEVERFAKGGLFFTSEPISLSDYIKAENKGGKDLYHSAAVILERNLRKNMDEAALPVLRVLDAFLPEFSLGLDGDTGIYQPTVGRDVVKNPLTVFLYGSGTNGIAAKVASKVSEKLAETLTEIAQSGKPVSAHPVFAGNPQQLLEDLAATMFEGNQTAARKWLSRPLEAEMSTKLFSALQSSILEHFAEPMVEAVNEATGGLADNMRITQRISQVQTLIFQDLFKQRVDARIEELKAQRQEGESTPLLSEAELRDIFIEVMKIAPIYSTDAQSFHIASPERATLENIRVGQSMGGRLSTSASYIEPADASVKVSPYLTIGTGDGRMIMNIYQNGDGSLDTSLPVFDGVELAADRASDASEQINQAVLEGWLKGNPYQAISEGFDQLLTYLTEEQFTSLSPETRKGITRALDLNRNLPKGTPRKTAQYGHMAALGRKIKAMARQAEARKKALADMAISVDHMASAGRPFVQEGLETVSDDPTDFPAIAEALENLRQRHEARLATDEERQLLVRREGYAQKPDPELQKLVETVGEAVSGYEGVFRITGDQVLGLLTDRTNASAEQRAMLRDLDRIVPLSEEAVYFFGEPAALEALRDQEYPDLPKSPIQHGQTFTRSAVTFIANASPETLVHEVLHTYTARILQDHYAGRELPEYVRIAISNLEALRNDVMEMVPEALETGDLTALEVLQDVLARNQDKPAVQLTELISYMLSNQDLIEKGKKTRTYRPLMSLVQKGLAIIKKLLGIRTNPGDTLFSNLRFNTQVLVTPAALSEDGGRQIAEKEAEVEEVLNQAFGEDPRLMRLERTYLSRLLETIRRDAGPVASLDKGAVARLRRQAQTVSELAQSAGFGLNPRQASVFAAIHATVQSGLKYDQPVQRHLYEAYSHVVRTLTADHFLEAWGLDQNTATAMEKARAAAMRNFIVGTSGLRQASGDRSDLMASFLALSQTNDDLRNVLRNMKPPKTVDVAWTSVDDVLRSAGTSMVNLISRASLDPRRMAKDLRQELDLLSETLTEVQGDRRLITAFRGMSQLMDKGNEVLSSRLAKGSEQATEYLTSKAKTISNKRLRGAAFAASLVASLGSKEAANATGESLTQMLNQTEGFVTLRNLLSDLRGMTDSNRPLMRLINPVKAQIDALRQDFREGVPEELARHFTRKLSKREWEHLHTGLAKTDLLTVGQDDALLLMRDPTKVSAHVAADEDALQRLAGPLADRYKAKARALARYMVRGEVTSQHLLRNAYAIANLYGERDSKQAQDLLKANPDLEGLIDRLSSLYAYELLDPAVQESLQKLATEEGKGLRILAGFQDAARRLELARRDRHGSTNEVARINGWKGYVPALTQEGASLIVADDRDGAALVRRGYVRVADYQGDKNEGSRTKKGYYQTSVGGRSAYRQGVAQTVHDTWQGVDAKNGTTVGGGTAGLFLGFGAEQLAKAVARAPAGSLDNVTSGEHLMPVFGENGAVVAYERSMDPTLLENLPKDRHLGRMLGVWAGRIFEENAADDMNTELVKTLKEIYDRDVKAGRKSEYINVADPNQKDPVIRDSWNTLGWRIKEDAAEAFGPETFMVRKDMVDDAIGYRAASLTDPWTGISRWSPETQKKLQAAAEFVAGDRAFKLLRQGENLVQDGVSYAKTTIIIRSIKVGVENILSNFLHLSMVGVSLPDMLQGTRDKFTEITAYTKNREEIQRLQVQAGAAINDMTKSARIAAQIQALEEANDRLSIAPLIRAGEFSTISENLTEADLAIREGRWADYIEKAVDRLPSWGQTAIKNLAITKDTALFQGLNRMVQYGDFVAKAVLYDHLTKRKGRSEREALDEIFEEFVAYNRLPGRGRDFAESMGMMWFWNYKIRIMKVLAKTLRERPLSALMMASNPVAASGIQTVWDGSLVGAGLDGRLGYSLGPEMGFNSPSLHPVFGMVL